MNKTDRTTKILLGAIVLLLAALLARPYLPALGVMPSAVAQDTIELGFLVEDPSTIRLDPKDTIREMHVLDQANCFIVRYTDRIEVYRVRAVEIDRRSIERLRR